MSLVQLRERLKASPVSLDNHLLGTPTEVHRECSNRPTAFMIITQMWALRHICFKTPYRQNLEGHIFPVGVRSSSRQIQIAHQSACYFIMHISSISSWRPMGLYTTNGRSSITGCYRMGITSGTVLMTNVAHHSFRSLLLCKLYRATLYDHLHIYISLIIKGNNC